MKAVDKRGNNIQHQDTDRAHLLEVQSEVLKNMAEGVSVSDESGYIIFTNPAEDRMFGYEPGELIGKHVSVQNAYPPQENVRRVAEVIRILQEKGEWEGEWENRRKDGTDFVTRARITSFQCEEQAYWVCVQQDITEQRRIRGAEQALERQLMAMIEGCSALLASPRSSEVLRTILRLARDSIRADAYAVWRKQRLGEWTRLESIGLSSDYPTVTTATGREEERLASGPLPIEDVHAEPMVQSRTEEYRREGIRSILTVPLWIQGEIGGIVVFYYREPCTFNDWEVRVASSLGNLVASALSTAELYEWQSSLRSEAEASERRAAFLADAGVTLSSSLDYEATLASVAKLSVPAFADWCSVHIFDGQEFRRVAVEHTDPEKVKFAYEFTERYPPTEGDAMFTALRTGESLLVEEIPDHLLEERAKDEEHLRLIRQLGLKSVILAPMVVGGRSVGLISFVTAESGRRYDRKDLRLAEELARRAAIAMEHARLYREARASEERFRRIVETAAEGIWTVDRSGVTTFANPQMASMLGYTVDEMIGVSVFDFVDATDLEEARARFQNAVDVTPPPQDLRLRKKDGSFLWVSVSASRLHRDNGDVLGLIGMFTDITPRRTAEKALRESEARFRQLAENIREVFYLVECDPCRTLYVSPAYEQIWGRPASGVYDDSSAFLEGTHPQDRSRVEEARDRQRRGEVTSVEYRVVRPDGTVRWVHDRAFPVRRTSGPVYRVAGIAEDTTERKLAADALAQRERDLVTILNNVPDVISRFGPDRRFQFTSAAMSVHTGIPADQFVGKTHLELGLPASLARKFNSALQRVFETGVSRGLEFDYAGPLGLRHYVSTTVPEFASDGSVCSALTITHDITDRKRIERQFRALAKVAVAISGADSLEEILEAVRERARTMVNASEVTATLFHAPQAKGTTQRHKLPRRITVAMTNRKGEEIGMLDAVGTPDRVFGVPDEAALIQLAETAAFAVENVRLTQSLQRSNEELRCANEDLNQFAYSASHDLQEPLRQVALYTQMLRRRYYDQLDNEAKMFIEFTLEGALRMETLVRDLLAYTQAVNISGPAPSRIDSNGVLASALANLKTAVAEVRAEIHAERLPPVSIQEIHLLQLFQNLIGNALKYRSDAKPVIRIYSHQRDSQVVFSVSDNGIGIHPRYSKQIFGVFKRLHGRGKYPGTGIGLAICQKIVERYNGRIWVDSEGEGKGSTFSFSLPD